MTRRQRTAKESRETYVDASLLACEARQFLDGNDDLGVMLQALEQAVRVGRLPSSWESAE